MHIPKHIKLVIPVEISHFAYHNGLSKAFAVYLYLKMHSDGKVQKKSAIMRELSFCLNIKERRTLKKYLDVLRKHNWIGFDAKTGTYYIRSFDAIRAKHTFYNRQGTVFFVNYLNKVPAYIIAVIMGDKLNENKFFWEVVNEGKLRTATKKKDVAFQSAAPSKLPKPKYNGICKSKIAKLFNRSLTTATKLKQQAENAGFLKVTHQFTDFKNINLADFKLRSNLEDIYPFIKGRLRFKKQPKVEDASNQVQRHITILIQSYDKIECLLQFKTVNKFNHLKVSATVKLGLKKLNLQIPKAA